MPTLRPSILVVAHDAATRQLLDEELGARYGRHYDVTVVTSNEEALSLLEAADQGDVALVLADRERGLPVLTATRALHPHAKRALLIGWNDHRSAREEVVGALSRGEADYYVTTPTVAPDERFHPRDHRVPRRVVAAARATVGRDPGHRRRALRSHPRDLGPPPSTRLPLRVPRQPLRRRSYRPRAARPPVDDGARDPDRGHCTARRPQRPRDRTGAGRTHPARRGHLRRGGDRWWARRTRSGHDRRFRRAAGRAGRADVDRRSGRNELHDPQLPRLPARRLRRGAREPGLRPGRPLRHRDGVRRQRRRHPRRRRPIPSSSSPTAPPSRPGRS